MRITRFLTGLLAIALIGLFPVVFATSAEATPRPIVVTGKEPVTNRFFIQGKVGADYAKQKVKVERRDRAGSPWKVVANPKTNSKGNFKVRVYPAKGSKKTCFRVKAKAVGAFEKSTSQQLCISVVRL